MIVVRIVQFVKIVQLVQLNYYGYIKFFVGICRYMGWSIYCLSFCNVYSSYSIFKVIKCFHFIYHCSIFVLLFLTWILICLSRLIRSSHTPPTPSNTNPQGYNAPQSYPYTQQSSHHPKYNLQYCI